MSEFPYAVIVTRYQGPDDVLDELDLDKAR